MVTSADYSYILLLGANVSYSSYFHSERATPPPIGSEYVTKMPRQQPDVQKHRKPCDPPSEESTNSFWHCRPSALLTAHRSTRALPKEADVVIIGSGMTGTSVAHHLFTAPNSSLHHDSEKGAGPSVVMLEAREACWGATGRVLPPIYHPSG